jgi:hypothetical protein
VADVIDVNLNATILATEELEIVGCMRRRAAWRTGRRYEYASEITESWQVG